MSQGSKQNSGNTQASWEEMADNDQNKNVPEKKERKPLKLGGSKAFNPNAAASSATDFLTQDPSQQQFFNQFQPGFQQGYQYQGQNQGGYQQYQGQNQGGFQPYQPSQGAPIQQQTTTAPKQTQAQTQQPPASTQTKAPAQTTQQAQNKPQTAQQTTKPEPKKESKKAPEPKPEPAKKDSKKGGKVEKKTGSDAPGKAKEERKENASTIERSYLKLQGLLANQKNVKVEKVDLEAAIKDSTKYDVVVDESKQPLNIVFIGHVDAGKSTTCGNILLITGQVDQNDVRKLKQEAKEKNRESWWIAYLMDIGDEEKKKGITVEVGKAKFETEHKRLTILDAPGHKNFVPNMIAGASQADVACLVVSARTGEFEAGFQKGGQTTEHALLARSLGVRDLVVLVNKMDENNIGWSQDRYEYIRKQLTPYLRDSCGYDIEKNVYWLPMSAQNGDNMKEGIKDPRGNWYKGPTFFNVLDNLPLPDRDPEGPVRIPVVDKFKDGSNLNVFGKIESGTITYGQKLTLIPSGESVTIHAIYNNDDKRLPYAKPGENVKLTLKGVEDDYVSKGDIICSNHSFAHVCSEIQCEITLLELPEHKAIMSTGYTCVIHLHAAVEEVYIKDIKSEFSKAEDKHKTAKYLKSGSIGIVHIASKDGHAICCEKFETSPHLGRFTLRDEGRTIASGKIIKVKPV